jgi:dihydroorotate dehydrogenase electron transfer subunit
MEVYYSKVISQEQVASGYFKINLEIKSSFSSFMPGMFVMLSILDRLDPLLPRPMGVFQLAQKNPESTIISIGYKVVGRGTNIFSELVSGDTIRVTGPFGKGWELSQVSKSDKVILVAGGIGITALYLIAKDLIKMGKTVTLLYGAATAEHLVFANEFEALGIYIQYSTDDGSHGNKGLVTENLPKYLESGTAVLACGPNPMLKSVTELCNSKGIDPQLSFEQHMACGFGVCLGCNISLKDEKTGATMQKRVCKEGPVFKASEVVW